MPRGDARSVELPALDADASSSSGTDVKPGLIVLTRGKANTSAGTAAPDAAAVPPTAPLPPSPAQEWRRATATADALVAVAVAQPL